ncbi:uncharacterized protein PV09_01073 [Verruconis gallopava]|uniref:Uncharacterized protein n=1 Tax=Verruconis gallopava TaxID=253628 RepID=A0A0D1XZA8_9PEZI|nr:uncharacterized protein PV09_01073 [Verruconis gallopava]KIW08141.1 hypothetical protein PV09_01073 [Verruconis gallopava]
MHLQLYNVSSHPNTTYWELILLRFPCYSSESRDRATFVKNELLPWNADLPWKLLVILLFYRTRSLPDYSRITCMRFILGILILRNLPSRLLHGRVAKFKPPNHILNSTPVQRSQQRAGQNQPWHLKCHPQIQNMIVSFPSRRTSDLN